MAFVVKLYVLDCDPEVVDKTNYLTNENEISGVLLQDAVDVSTPYVELDHAVSINPGSGKASFWTANYCYIAQLHRYFFITGKEIIDNDHFVVRLETDVLMTYRTIIKGTTFFVDRNENAGSWYIPDGNIPMNAEITISKNALSTWKPFDYSIASDHPCFMICCAGGIADGQVLDPGADIGNGYITPRSTVNYYCMTLNQLRNMAKAITDGWNIQNWIDDFKSGIFWIKGFPFEITSNHAGNVIGIGGKLMTGVSAYAIHKVNYEFDYKDSKGSNVLISLPEDFRLGTGDQQIKIYLPLVGWQDLDPLVFTNNQYLNINYKINVITGVGVCTLYAVPGSTSASYVDNIIAQYEFNSCIDVPLTINNASEINRNTITSAVSALLAVAGAAATKNPALLGGAMANAATTVANNALAKSQFGISGSVVSGCNPIAYVNYPVIVYQKRTSPVLDDATQKARYAARFGKMYQQSTALSSLTGRTVVTKFEMEMPSGCTTTEYEMIRQRLAEGVIL